MTSTWLKGWQLGLLAGGLFAQGLLGAPVREILTDEQVREKAAVAYDKHCADSLALRAVVNPEDGRELIASLREFTDRLEARWRSGDLTAEKLFSENIVYWEDRLVPDPENPNGPHIPYLVRDNAGQKMPFRELRLPHAYTGMFVPTSKSGGPVVDPKLFHGMMLAFPGIGFSVSVAKSLLELCGTFNKGSNPAMTYAYGKKLRILSIAVDAPGNGMAEHAPFGLGHADGVMEVARHAKLIAQVMFPSLADKLFAIGRSQGGLNVFEMAARYGDLKGVIPLNASHPAAPIVRECVRRHEEMAKPENIIEARKWGFDCNFHERSWLMHELFTATYTMFDKPSLVPSLHLLGSKDWSYPEEFIPSWQEWASRDPKMREYRVFNGHHNLWNKKQHPEVYDQVVNEMVRFMARHLQLN